MNAKKYRSDNYPLIAYWQSEVHKNIIRHNSITEKMLKIEKSILKSYDVVELKNAIDNYDDILGSDDQYYNYKHSFQEFFREGVKKAPPFERFLAEMKPKENMMRFDLKSNLNPEMKRRFE